jgi:YD repeat-containing protein
MGRQYKNETVSVGFNGTERVISNSETAYRTIPENPAEDQAITGRIEEVKDRRGFVSESRYDTGGRLVGSRRFDPKGNLLDETSYEYDALGRQEKVWSLGDGLTTTTYDCFGRTATTSRHAEDLDNLIRTHYAYDIGGRQTASKVTIGDLNDTTGVWTVNSYDDAKDGRLDAVYLYQTDPAAPTGTKLSYLYDDDGRRVGEKDAADHWTYTYYDEVGQVAATILNWQAGATPTP